MAADGVLRGPPITLTCDCGERRELHYGERWTCAQCGRTWNTRRIPVEQYKQIRRIQRRYRRVPLAIGMVVVASLIAAVVLGKTFGGLLIVALAVLAWSTYARPVHRRRYRQAIANLPSWKIDPE